MPVKPDDIDQDSWEDALETRNKLWAQVHYTMTDPKSLDEEDAITIAYAIMAAKEEEREACAAAALDLENYKIPGYLIGKAGDPQTLAEIISHTILSRPNPA